MFRVSVDGVLVTFADVPSDCLEEHDVEVPGFGMAHIMVIESQRTDRSTKQHGIAWWVNRRLVGECGWRLSDHAAIVDGRTEVAKRFTFIVRADFLTPAVLPDWSDFNPNAAAWITTEPVIQEKIRAIIGEYTKERRQKARHIVSATHAETVRKLPTVSRGNWMRFLDQLLQKCPTLGEHQVSQVMGLLANMEVADSQYSLLEKLHELTPDQLDEWNDVLDRWTVSTAKLVLDQVERRLRIIEEIRAKANDTSTDEVRDLQPLIGQSLWIFGPQFESIQFTSNQGMTTVFKKIFKDENRGSRNRPDFVMTVDSSIGFYALPAFDGEFNEVGNSMVVIVELKKPGVPLGSAEKEQVNKYIIELRERGHVTNDTEVTAYILGDSIRPFHEGPRSEGDRIVIRPLLYSAFLGQAEKRMMNLHSRLVDAPFMQQALAELYPEEEETVAEEPEAPASLFDLDAELEETPQSAQS